MRFVRIFLVCWFSLTGFAADYAITSVQVSPSNLTIVDRPTFAVSVSGTSAVSAVVHVVFETDPAWYGQGSGSVTGGVALIGIDPLPVGLNRGTAYLQVFTPGAGFSDVATKTFTVNVSPVATQVSRPEAVGTPRVGSPIQLRAQASLVATPGAPPNELSFYEGDILLGKHVWPTFVFPTVSFRDVRLHSIRAVFHGDPKGYLPSESPILGLAITGTPILEVTSMPRVLKEGAALSWTVDVSGPTGRSVVPTGRVVLRKASGVLGTASLSNGTATLVAPAGSLSVGDHDLWVTYEGDSFYDALGSASVRVQVSADLSATATTMKIDLTGGVVRVRAEVTGGASTPSGTVTFRDMKTGATYPVPLNSGSAVLQRPEVLGHWLEASYSGDSTHQAGLASKVMVLAPLNAFSYRLGDFAADEIVAIFGEAFATSSAAADATLPETLAATQVLLVDSSGAQQRARFYFASPTQATVVLPAGLATGPAELQVRSSAGDVYRAVIRVVAVAPGLATANADGEGAPAAQVLRILPDGSSAVESPIQYESGTAKWVPAPIRFAGQELYLILYGTGFRGGAPVTCSAGDVALPVLYGGAQGTYAGLDQINVRLPSEMQGKGTVAVKCSAGGVEANPVTLLFP